MNRFVTAFHRSLMFLACLALCATFGTVTVGILARQVGWDLPGLDAYAGYSIAAALFLGMPGAFVQGDHIRVSLLLNRLSARSRAVLEYWSLGAGLALAIYLAWYAVRLVWVSYLTHDVSQAADATPLWLPQSLMALGAVGFAFALAQGFWARIQHQAEFARDADVVGEIARAE